MSTNFSAEITENVWISSELPLLLPSSSTECKVCVGAHVFVRISKQLLPFIMELRGENMLETQLYCYQRCYDLFITEIWQIFCCHVTKFKSHSILKGFPAWVSLAVSHKRAWRHGNATQANLPASQPPPSLFPGCYWACLVFVYWVKADWIHLSKQLKVCS